VRLASGTDGIQVAMHNRKKKKPQKLGRRTATASGPGADELARIALDLFAERHFDSVSIRDIGRAANVNSAMIYYHYEDKADLFCAAIESAIDEAFDLFAKHCDTERHETPAEAIGAWFDVHVALYKRLRNVIKISLDCKGIVGTVPEANEPIKRFYRHEREILQKLIHEGVQSGLFQKVDSAVVATMISTILDGVLARSIFLKDFEMVKTVGAFKQAILLYLGYTGRRVRGAPSELLGKVDA
jgi:AcrR family transcriptional regulator